MGGRAKRSRADIEAEEAEAWIAQLNSNSVRPKAAPTPPAWPVAAHSFAARMAALANADAGDVRAAVACAACLRMALAFRCGSSAWFSSIEARLGEHLRKLRNEDAVLDESTKAFHSSGGASSGNSAGPPSLRALKPRAALDALLFALWAAAARAGLRVPHPVRTFEAVEKALLATAEGASAVRRVLCTDAALATSWGAASPAVSGCNQSCAAPLWQPGACALLRVARARWVEAVVLLQLSSAATSAATSAEPSAATSGRIDIATDASGARLRAGLHRWLCTGRDAGARHMAFAVPSTAAIELICRGRRKAAVVELGAGNGYWAQLCQRQLVRRGARMHALDVSPPPTWQQNVWRRRRRGAKQATAAAAAAQHVTVRFGTAEALGTAVPSAELSHELAGRGQGTWQTLLLCMPSPGETSLAEDVLRAFRGGASGNRYPPTLSVAADLPLPFPAHSQSASPTWASGLAA